MNDSGIYATSPARRQTRKQSSYPHPKSDSDDLDDYEEESGRASRARTRLIVEGFSNLALIAIFFAGVQAQLVSDTNDENSSALSVATSAAFFGGLIFSVFTAILATLSGRWFSILREDDADYLSSRWLAQDSGRRGGDVEKGSRHVGPDLKEYLDFQIKSLRDTLEKKRKLSAKSRRGTVASTPMNTIAGLPSDGPSPPRVDSPVSTGTGDEKANLNDGNSRSSFDPVVFELECILSLLYQERTGESGTFPNLQPIPETRELPRSTWKEHALGWALLAPLAVCIPSFVLFTAGILMLAWDKQPRAVAIFTSATVLVCVLPLLFFFVKHRHKHVIKHINLGRASL
ncbi:unnamed protein product [Rhizoctonia solani]|uniref:Transmembrane protein n=1 Tax=Rhizoctonia solani TaxID=456999 RepID=A0A8H3D2U9_9AGAM|nr:unnamed protein product [Rhizoctonia solani]